VLHQWDESYATHDHSPDPRQPEKQKKKMENGKKWKTQFLLARFFICPLRKVFFTLL
jgi:hypothetical protein